jgi:alpha-1,2-mannosyltransferase
VAYWTEILWDPSRIGGVEYAGNQSVLGTLSRLLGHEASTSLWFVVAGSVAALSLVAAALLWRSTSPAARPLAVGMAALGMVLASPISWDHHWVWFVPIVLALWLSGLPRARVVAGAVVVIAASRAIWWAPFRNGVEYDWNLWQGLSGNLYVLTAVGLVLLGVGWGGRVQHVSNEEHLLHK